MPEDLITSGQNPVAWPPHKLRLWQAHGEHFANRLAFKIWAWTPLYALLMLLPLT